MKWLSKLVERFWFQPAPAARLAALRIAIGSYALWYLGQRHGLLMRVARGEEALFRPVGVAGLLDAPLPLEVVHWLYVLTIAANVLFILGFKHRYTGPLFGGLLLFLLCYRNSWSMIYHSDNVLVMHVLVLGLTASASAWSLDRLARDRRPGRWLLVHGTFPLRESEDHWAYGWPIRLLCAITVSTYFLAGFAKVTGPLGWSWSSGTALRGQIAVDGLRKELLSDGASSLVFQLYEHVELFTVLAVGTLIIELGAPLVLLNRRAAQLWSVATLSLHWGIYILMGITFRYQLSGVIFLPFFALEKVITIPRKWLVDRLGQSADGAEHA